MLFSVQVLENCNYAVELGKKLNFVLVGIGGELFRSWTPAPLILMVVVLRNSYPTDLLHLQQQIVDYNE
jgi:hypothetical protein